MVKMLVRHGNSLALVLDKPILDLLKITEETPLEIVTLDGCSLQIRPAKAVKAFRKSVRTAIKRSNQKFAKTLKHLAK